MHASRHGQVAARRAELRQSCGRPHLALRQTLDDDWAPWPRKLGFESFLRRPNARVRPRDTHPVRCARAPAKARRRPSAGSRSCARPSSACRRARQQLLCARARVGDQARAGLGETSARNARARHRSSCALRRCEKSVSASGGASTEGVAARARGTSQLLARTRLRQRRDPRVARADDQGTTCRTPVNRRVSRARPRALARAHTPRKRVVRIAAHDLVKRRDGLVERVIADADEGAVIEFIVARILEAPAGIAARERRAFEAPDADADAEETALRGSRRGGALESARCPRGRRARTHREPSPSAAHTPPPHPEQVHCEQARIRNAWVERHTSGRGERRW